MVPMIDMAIDPEFGSTWGLWCSDPPRKPDLKEGEELGPDHFGLRASTSKLLLAWNREWQENFIGDPPYYYWLPGFNIDRWVKQGDLIADLIASELPSYHVIRSYRERRQFPVGRKR